MTNEARKHHELMREIDVLERELGDLQLITTSVTPGDAAEMIDDIKRWQAQWSRVLDAARQVVKKR